jgi:hydrogenase-4 component B
MDQTLLMIAWLTPLAVLPVSFSARGRWLTALAALPAICAAVLVPADASLDIPWLLMGVQLELDATARLFLLFSGVIWFAAGMYAALDQASEQRPGRLCLFMLLAMSGNLLLILAADMLSFYAGFAFMGLSAYGLVVHRRSQRARRAGRVYLVWTLIGEVALLSAILLLASSQDSLRFDELLQREIPVAAAALLLLGFGIKLALPGLHVWLPLAYPAAPAVAAAVISGPVFNAGLLGWLRFLPPGSTGLESWGELMQLLGVIGVLLGVIVGLLQRDPRAILGYSSIVKSGLITAAFGVALAQPDTASTIAAAIVLFAMQHLLVKGALFLGVAEWERNGNRHFVIAGLGALALALAGAPLTAGATVKTSLTDALAAAGVDSGVLYGFAAIGTVLLMTRFLWLVTRAERPVSGGFKLASLPWLVLLPVAIWLPLASDTPLI